MIPPENALGFQITQSNCKLLDTKVNKLDFLPKFNSFHQQSTVLVDLSLRQSPKAPNVLLQKLQLSGSRANILVIK